MKGAVTLFDAASVVSWLASYRISCAYMQYVAFYATWSVDWSAELSPRLAVKWRVTGASRREKTGARTPEIFGHRERSVIIIGERRWPRCIPRIPRDPPRRTRALLLTLCSFVCTGCTTATWRPPGPPSRECARLKYRIFNCCHNNENLTADISRVTSGEARLYIAFLVYVTFSLHLLHM